MIDRDENLLPEPRKVRSVHQGEVIAANWKSVQDMLRKKNAPSSLWRLAAVSINSANHAADRLRNIELRPDELAARADIAQEFAEAASSCGVPELTARQADRQPLPAEYHDGSELVSKMREMDNTDYSK